VGAFGVLELTLALLTGSLPAGKGFCADQPSALSQTGGNLTDQLRGPGRGKVLEKENNIKARIGSKTRLDWTLYRIDGREKQKERN